MESLKLTVEPIPTTSANKSLSRLLPKHRWDKIRRGIYATHGHRCVICGVDPKRAPFPGPLSEFAPKLTDPDLLRLHGGKVERLRERFLDRRPPKVRLECHEAWEYDEATNVQKLSALVALCTRCHQVKHWSWAATKRFPPSWWPEEMRAKYEGQTLRKGAGKWRGVWDDEQRFALHRAIVPHHYSLEDHFMYVNGCDLKTLREHVEEAAEVCYRRSHHEWQVDFGKLY